MHSNMRTASIKPLLAKFGIDAPDIQIDDLVLDSREVAIHKGFVAVKGHSLDGRDFVPQAISLGAKVILVQSDYAEEHGNMDMREQSLLIQFYGLADKLSDLAAHFYHHPADDIQIVAVTGTNGKTSTVQLISQFGTLSAKKSASIGTLGAGIYQSESQDAQWRTTLNTTPDALQMQRLMAEFKASDVKQVALEASSHALVQGRISALKTDVAVFTNLSRDHLDYHGSMSQYAKAKRRLLDQPGLRQVVLNFDDAETKAWLGAVSNMESVILFSQSCGIDNLPEGCRYVVAKEVSYSTNGASLTIVSSWGDGETTLSLLGQFNVANVLAAFCVQLALGEAFDSVLQNCASLTPVAGRMEVFQNPRGANVVVDYAHTPDGLQQALIAARHHCDGKLFCIFGCGGDRDQGKRPQMGEAAESLADQIIITNDNVRTEEPQQIVDGILAGCRNPEQIQVILDRKQAIQSTVRLASDKDLILVAGKGHEDYQIIGNEKVPYDERRYVKNLLEGNAQ